jgi:DNA-binding MarR family transcriptional regulator
VPPTTAPAPHLGYLLSEAAKCVREATAEALAPLGLAPREFGALDALALAGPMTQRALGELRRIDRTTMVALVDHLERLGLVARAPNPQDRRAHALRVTAEGRRVVARAREAAQGVEAAFLAPVGPVDREALRRALTTALRSAAPVRPD